jgi:CBS domain-containing protein
MKVEQILQVKGSAVFTVAVDASVAAAAAVLNAHNIGAVVAIHADGSLAGILSERDIVRRLSEGDAGVLKMRVSDCMTPDPITCGLEETSDQLMGRMTTHRVRHIPVLEGGALVGLVSIGDVVKCKIEETEQEAAALRDYIAS